MPHAEFHYVEWNTKSLVTRNFSRPNHSKVQDNFYTYRVSKRGTHGLYTDDLGHRNLLCLFCTSTFLTEHVFLRRRCALRQFVCSDSRDDLRMDVCTYAFVQSTGSNPTCCLVSACADQQPVRTTPPETRTDKFHLTSTQRLRDYCELFTYININTTRNC